MSTYSIVFSPTNGTKKVADILVKEFAKNYTEIDLCDRTTDYEKVQLTAEDICFISVPSYGGRVPALAVERLQKLSGNGAKAVLVVVYGNRDYDDTLLELYDVAKQQNFICASGITAIAEHSLMRQYAAGRPDVKDEGQLKEFAQQLKDKLSQSISGELNVKGNRPYKEYNGVPFKPITSETCNQCGACVKACPADALSSEAPGTVDEEKCISCMRCIQVCPENAKHLDEMMLNAVAEKMEPLFRERKENEIFW